MSTAQSRQNKHQRFSSASSEVLHVTSSCTLLLQVFVCMHYHWCEWICVSSMHRYLCITACFCVCEWPVCLRVCHVCAAPSLYVCHTAVAVCSNLRSQLATLVIIQTLPFAPTLKAFIWRTWNSGEPDKASNAVCHPKRSGKGEEMHGGIDGIVFLWRFAFTLELYLLCSNHTREPVITGF